MRVVGGGRGVVVTIGHAVIVVRFAVAGRRRLVVLMLPMRVRAGGRIHSFPCAVTGGVSGSTLIHGPDASNTRSSNADGAQRHTGGATQRQRQFATIP